MLQLPCIIDICMNCVLLFFVFTMQLIYESTEGAGTIQLITLKPEDLDPNKTKQFEVLGIEIPSIKYTYLI